MHAYGVGIDIDWQHNPVVVGDDGADKRNGAQIEDVLHVTLDRLRFLQGEVPCRENALAITKLEEAIHWLDHRTADRVNRGVEGTHDA